MLILEMKMGQILVLEGIGEITMHEKSGRRVRLAIDVPKTQVVRIQKPGAVVPAEPVASTPAHPVEDW
jgi:hypothetical protein